MEAFKQAVLPNVHMGIKVVIDNARTHDMALLATLVSDRGGVLLPLP